jgi:hypothetical protein
MPELPHPTISTFFPANACPDLYSHVCRTRPANSRAPGKSGNLGTAFSPVATITHRAMSTSGSPDDDDDAAKRTAHASAAASNAASSTRAPNRGATPAAAA